MNDLKSITLHRATSVAANFFARFFPSNVKESKRRDFVIRLEQLMASRFQLHWYPDNPTLGQAFRCIRINSSSNKDPLIQQALIAASLTYADIHLPLELTVWIDPDQVACRFGEDQGSIASLMSFTHNIALNKMQTKALRFEDQSAFRPVILVRIPTQRTHLIRFELQCVFVKK